MPKRSSCVILCRGEGDALEVFWARRLATLRFLGGYHAFIGGGVDPDDDALPGLEGDALAGCAARELLEELGLLALASGLVSAHQDASLASLREALLEGAGARALIAWAQARGATLDPERLRPRGRWTTPDWAPLRFETEFFVLHVSEAEVAQLDLDQLDARMQRSELERGAWIAPARAGAMHRACEVFVTPPTLAFLRHLGATSARIDQDAADALLRHEIGADSYMVALRSPTLPPATHTNAYVIAHHGAFIVLDPGAQDEAELGKLAEVIDARLALGDRFEAVVLTHHHPDHVGGVAWLIARYGAPVWAHEATARLAGASWEIDRALGDSDGLLPDAKGAPRLSVMHTPGHASDHLAFYDAVTGALYGGDLIASQGTILVSAPDGAMEDYLASLARVVQRNARVLFPAHGWALLDASGAARDYIAHRLAREARVREAVRELGSATAAELVPLAYADAPPQVWPLATLSLIAHLERLILHREVTRSGDRYALA